MVVYFLQIADMAYTYCICSIFLL